jgi:hypothetical protein
MGWTVPITWVSGQLVLASQLNVGIRDQLNTTAAATMTAQGDLLIATAASTPARLAKDTNATRYLSNTGTSNNPAWAQVNVANGVTGTLPVGNGGTGVTALTDHYVLVGSGTAAVTPITPSTDGLVLTSNGTGSDPSFQVSTGGKSVGFIIAMS